MADVVHTRRARADLKRIWRYIALDSETAADRFLLRLASRIDDLSLFPEAGPPQDHIRPGLRMVVVARYRIIYEYHREADVVEIVAVIEPYRNLEDQI